MNTKFIHVDRLGLQRESPIANRAVNINIFLWCHLTKRYHISMKAKESDDLTTEKLALQQAIV